MPTKPVEISNVVFSCAALGAAERPKEWFPHVAVSGRSNVGKSSLLNWLFRRPLAKVAKAPGKTRTINFFLVDTALYLVDLPGYGYAKVNRQMREAWGRELTKYLNDEPRLAGVICLVDIRRGPTELDRELFEMLINAERDFVIVLTKADKLSRGKGAAQRARVQRELGLGKPPLAVSVRTGEGRRELIQQIDSLAAAWRHQGGGN
ncbi:MAG: YihA family ribosome biogenesis GTP-binding protein [bacterium]|nr:YihA family ribosome biogenesis GTP-binding protein [bacterium]